MYKDQKYYGKAMMLCYGLKEH